MQHRKLNLFQIIYQLLHFTILIICYEIKYMKLTNFVLILLNFKNIIENVYNKLIFIIVR